MHCGGQTLAQMPHDVHQSLPAYSGSSWLYVTRNGMNRKRSGIASFSSGYSTVTRPRLARLCLCWKVEMSFFLPSHCISSTNVSTRCLNVTPSPFNMPTPYLLAPSLAVRQTVNGLF